MSMADGSSLQHPGVYVQELPATPSVQGVATSIPVFIGTTQKLDAADANVARRVNGWADYQTRYGGLVWGAYVSSAVYTFFAEGGAECYVISVAGSGDNAAKSAQVKDSVLSTTLAVSAASAGAWGNLLRVEIADSGAVQNGASGFFNVNVMAAASDLKDSGSLGTAVGRRLIRQYIADNSIALVNGYYILESFGLFTASSVGTGGLSCKLATQINAASLFIQILGVTPGTTKAQARAVRASTGGTALTGGKDAVDYTQAMLALASVPEVSLVATPDASVADMTDGADDTTVKAYKTIITQNVMLTIENNRLQNLFYVIDAPFLGTSIKNGNVVDNSANVSDFVLGTSDNQPLTYDNAAIYFPWPIVYNPVSKTSMPIPPSGPVIGRYAYTDLTAGVHVSPAGVANGHLRTATGLTKWVTEVGQDQLNPIGINVIRTIPGYGITVYGARTLAVGGQWQYVAVRRFVTFVEQSLKTALQWVVFQPNGELLWSIVVLEVSAFLTMLWREGALFGSTAAEAFFVTCDATNNPPTQRTKGVLNVDVGLAVLYPAEFVVLRIAQMTGAPSTGS
jgi:phage tail sheath protein FI